MARLVIGEIQEGGLELGLFCVVVNRLSNCFFGTDKIYIALQLAKNGLSLDMKFSKRKVDGIS